MSKEDESIKEDDNACVQLGFSVAIQDGDFVSHESPCWIDWDGGQLGGRPSWLQPRDLPIPKSCDTCEAPLKFVCQIYAPTENAFHRSLYVFACHATVQVLRTQLSQVNDFWPEECEGEDAAALEKEWENHLPSRWNVALCQVCGQKGKGKCPIQGVSFCGRHHQVEHKKHVFEKNNTINDSFLPSVYAKSQLVVEEEPDEDVQKTTSGTLMFENSNKDENDEDLEQSDLNRMTGAMTGCKDETTIEFYTRISRPNNAQEQCLRYCRWPVAENKNCGPLWISSHNQPSDPPPCQYCGAPRRFEFQLQPQMLYHLLKNHQNKKKASDETKQAVLVASAITEREEVPQELQETLTRSKEQLLKQMYEDGALDWGVIAIYTCTASCEIDKVDDELGAYREEYAWRQGPLE